MIACNYRTEHIPISDEAQEAYRLSLERAKRPRCNICIGKYNIIYWFSDTFGSCIECNRKYIKDNNGLIVMQKKID